MLLQVGTDQRFFQETTARFLDERVPTAELRRLRDDPLGYDPGYWRQGAELGWTSLLVAEEHGGGRLSDHGLVDLAMLAYEFGRHAAPGPLMATNVVAAALSECPCEAGEAVLTRLVEGAATATWCPGVESAAGASSTTVAVHEEGDHLVVSGTAPVADSVAGAAHLLVTGVTGSGLTQVLVDRDAPGVTVAPLRCVDLTRRLGKVVLAGVSVERTSLVGGLGRAAGQVARQRRVALAVSTAEAVGAMQAGFDMTVAWAFDRYSFGRPLASYQEIKHRFADMKTWLEASHAVSDAATDAAATGADGADELLSAAKAYVGQFGSELLQDCVQIHGGIGVTFEHDLHAYLRRHTLFRTLLGTPDLHRGLLAGFEERRAAP